MARGKNKTSNTNILKAQLFLRIDISHQQTFQHSKQANLEILKKKTEKNREISKICVKWNKNGQEIMKYDYASWSLEMVYFLVQGIL